ncbi:MAG TPA: arginine--tRNA ligase, partial [Gemmatimonadales bacterium]
MKAHDAIRAALARAAERLGAPGAEVGLERPKDPAHGDVATNLALSLAKRLNARPRDVAQRILDALDAPPGLVKKTDIAGPGFINFFLAETVIAGVLPAILIAGAEYGRSDGGRGTSVNVEFVSANPTGPLHVGHGRGAAIGDAIAALLEWTGHTVTREFYVNDAGAQVDKLAQSLWARVQQQVGREAAIPEGGYHGAYLVELAEGVLVREGRSFADLPADEGLRRCRAIGVQSQRAEQDADLREFGVRFDAVFFESELYKRDLIAPALAQLDRRGHVFERDGARWLRTSDFGDDKDRVLRKSDGTYTYFV